jgi:hypothetical protein
VDLAAVDAAIACYRQKKLWSFWRPVTAIPLADTDGSRRTHRDRSGRPLRVTAPSTEYPSGHACFTAGVVTALRTFFGRDDLSFSASSADSGTTRHFDSLSEAMAELVEAKIRAGVHIRTASEDGQSLGEAVARDVLRREFGPRDNG